MIILNRIGALMLLSLIILLVVMVLSRVPVSSMMPLAGTVLFVEDVAFRIVRYDPQNDKFLSAIHWSGGGSFFFLPAWLCAVIGLIYAILSWNILITYGAALCLTDVATRLRRAQVDRTPVLKAIIDWRLGSILVVIPLWAAGLLLILFAGMVHRK
jgi:hypothetical protein